MVGAPDSVTAADRRPIAPPAMAEHTAAGLAMPMPATTAGDIRSPTREAFTFLVVATAHPHTAVAIALAAAATRSAAVVIASEVDTASAEVTALAATAPDIQAAATRAIVTDLEF